MTSWKKSLQIAVLVPSGLVATVALTQAQTLHFTFEGDLDYDELRAGPVSPSTPGLFYYGGAQASLPFGNGTRCAGSGGGGVFRLPVVFASSSGCLAQLVDNTSPPLPSGQFLPGATWHFQAWYRDLAAGGANFDLSDGLTILFTP